MINNDMDIGYQKNSMSVISHSNTGAFPKVAGYAMNPQGGPNLMEPIITVS